MGAGFGSFLQGFATSASKTREEKAREKLDKERMAKQDAQFQQQLALQREQLAATNARNDRLDEILKRRGEAEDIRLGNADTRATAAAAREQEQHDLTVGIWRDPARRDAMIASRMAELKSPILQLQQLEFTTGKMPDRYEREMALGKLEETAKSNQNALTAAQTKAAEQNYQINEALKPIQEQTAKLALDYAKWKQRPGALEQEDALQQANIFATKVGTMQTIQGMMLANAREGRESLKLSKDELSNLSEMIITTAGVMPGNTPDEKMQAAQNYWTKAWGVASDMMDPKMIDAIGGTMAAGPDYQRFKQDTALVGTGIINGRQATPQELGEAMKRTEAFAAKLATADEGLRATSRAARTVGGGVGAVQTPAQKYTRWATSNPDKVQATGEPKEIKPGDVAREVLSVPGLKEAAEQAYKTETGQNGSSSVIDDWLGSKLKIKGAGGSGSLPARAARIVGDINGEPMFDRKAAEKIPGRSGRGGEAGPTSYGRGGGYDRNGNYRQEGEEWQYPGET